MMVPQESDPGEGHLQLLHHYPLHLNLRLMGSISMFIVCERTHKLLFIEWVSPSEMHQILTQDMDGWLTTHITQTRIIII